MQPFGMTILLLLVALTSAAAKAETFTYSDLLSEESPTGQAVAYMGSLVKERTNGRHTILEVADNVTDTDSYTLARLRTGQLTMARVRLATFHSTVPETVVPAFPYLFTSKESQRRVLDGPLGDAFLEKVSSRGVVALCLYDTGARSFFGAKPVRRAEDLKGLRLRIQGGDAFGEVLRAIGAVPQSLPLGRINEGLRTRAIDGADLEILTYAASHHYEYAKFYSFTEHSMPPSVLLFSQRVWDRLSSEDRSIIKTAARESVPYLRRHWDEREIEARRLLEKAGVQLVADVDKKSLAEAMVPAYQLMIDRLRLQDWVTRIEQMEGR